MSARPAAASYPHVFHGGRWVASSDATVQVSSQAMRYALSVFEGIRLYRQHETTEVRPFLLDAHLRRLRDSLVLMRIPDPGVATLTDLVGELVTRNRITDDAYVRIAVSAGNPGLIGTDVEPLVTVSAVPMARKRWLAQGAGMRLQVSGWQRGGEESFPSAAKNISGYAGPRLALLAARDVGYDGCVLTNRAGRLCEAPTAALFLVRDGVLLTPSLTEGVLPSITRRWVLGTAPALGVRAEERPVSRSEAYLADEAFLCGTGIEFAPVQSFDGHVCRAWPEPGVLQGLVKRYFEDVRGAADGHDREGVT